MHLPIRAHFLPSRVSWFAFVIAVSLFLSGGLTGSSGRVGLMSTSLLLFLLLSLQLGPLYFPVGCQLPMMGA
jgi:hypothetical protein